MSSIRLLFLLSLIAATCLSGAQEHPMASSGASFLAARLEGSSVVPPSESSGSGTGVFVFSAVDHKSMLDYQITYAMLSSPDVRGISLRNFGSGKEGRIVHSICGAESQKCPEGPDGTLRGTWSSEDSRLPLAPDLWKELANRRIYVEIETAKGKEIRSQLAPSPFMAMASEAQADLRGVGNSERATGTAALRLVRIGAQMQLGVLLTVANAGQDPTRVSLIDKANRFSPLVLRRLPEAKAGRTLRIVSKGAELKALSDPRFVAAFAANELTVVVYLGEGEGNTLRGQVKFAR